MFLEHSGNSGCSSEWGVSCSSLQTHMLHVIYMTWYTWYTWLHHTRDTHDTYDLHETRYPHVTRAHVLQPHCEWLSPSAERGVDWSVIINSSDQPLCSEPHTGRGHQPKLSYICRASLSSLLSPVSYEVIHCNSPRYSEIGCPTTLITIILTIARQLCLWSLMKSFIVLDRDIKTIRLLFIAQTKSAWNSLVID